MTDAASTGTPGDETPINHVTHSHELVFVRESPLGDNSLDVELRYDTRDPFAVAARFRKTPEQTTWLFSRELLMAGLVTPSGYADIRIEPCSDDLLWTRILLETPDGAASLRVRGDDLAAFLNCTYAMVPPGDEQQWIDFEFELHRLVAG